jgi:hypothetical protein
MNNRERRVICCLLASAGLGLVAFGGQASAAAGVTISPFPGALTAMPRTQISFLGASAGALHSISVVGSSSGRHAGRLRAYSSAVGVSFLPSKPFAPGEHVVVHARLSGARGRSSSLSSSFTVAQPAAVPLTEFPTTPGTAADVQSFQSEPGLRPPVVTVHQAAGAASAPGYVFAAPFIGPGQYGPMIFDNAGRLVWFHAVPAGEDGADFQAQSFHGENVLTWWQGHTLQLGYGLGEDVIADSNYKTVAVVRAGNGLQADEHEFNVTPQGSAYVLAYSPVVADLSSAGGPGNGVAVEGVIQKIDIHTGLVMWEWHSLGNVAVSESYSKLPTTATAPYDYFHINSLTSDSHGNLLISARNTWALYDISARTGRVMWRLGGKKSTYALGPNVAFAYQHNALWLPGGQISLFDDEGAPTDHRQPGQCPAIAGRRLDGRLGRASQLHRIQRSGTGDLRRAAAARRVQLPRLPPAMERPADHAAGHLRTQGGAHDDRLRELERGHRRGVVAIADRAERQPADRRLDHAEDRL